MLKRSVLLTGLVLFGNSDGMITKQQQESRIDTQSEVGGIADLVEKTTKEVGCPEFAEPLTDWLTKAMGGNNQDGITDVLNATKPVLKEDVMNIVGYMFDNAAELHLFEIAKLLLQASPEETCAGYAFNQGLLVKSAEGTEFAAWLLKHPSAKLQYTPRYEDNISEVSHFFSAAVGTGNKEIIHSVINGTLEELALYEHFENLERFLKYELDPVYNSADIDKGLLPSKNLIRDMFNIYIDKRDRSFNCLFGPFQDIDKDKTEEMKQLVSNWASL